MPSEQPSWELQLAALQRALEDGTWRRRNAQLLDLDEYDAGYKLIISEAVP